MKDYGKNKYKLHYIYREFTVDFFAMDLNSLPKNASSLKFSKHNAHIMSLCLTLHINLGLSLRKTSQALKDLYNISISHQQIANYCKTAAVCIKPLSIIMITKQEMYLLLTRPISKSEVSKHISGLLWMPQAVPLSDTSL